MYNNKKEHFELYNPKLDIIEVMHFRFVSNILQIWFASVSIARHNGTKEYGGNGAIRNFERGCNIAYSFGTRVTQKAYWGAFYFDKSLALEANSAATYSQIVLFRIIIVLCV